MITRDGYLAMAAHAIAQYERLRSAVSHDTEIVYVVSKDVCRAMQLEAYAHYIQNDYKFSQMSDGYIGTYCGVRIICINENTDRNYFIPAVYTRVRERYIGLQIGDLILFDEDFSSNLHLFYFAGISPDEERIIMCTGFTASFTLPYIQNVAANFADSVTAWVSKPATKISLASNRTAKTKKRSTIENELNPGNTELIDEYLHSFLMGGC